MERTDILKLNIKINNFDDIEEIKNNLKKEYEISHGSYENSELRKAILEKKPVIIKNHFLIGYDPDGTFIDVNNNKVSIERMVKAIIFESVKESGPEPEFNADPFAIIGTNEWDDITQFMAFIGKLKVGEIFLPPHSAIFNFLDGSKDKKIVSALDGVNVNLYSQENHVDNAIHEIGHLFWRDCVNFQEKKAFKEMFKTLKPSAIYVYEWERETEEEVFCTIYKWYVKSLLLNKAFYNILEYEEPRGLTLLQGVLSRLANDRATQDIWNLNKKEIFDYLNPRFDATTQKYLRKAGSFDRIKDIEIPVVLLNNIDRYENQTKYIVLEKATVPVKGKFINFEPMTKAQTPTNNVFVDMDGVIADFSRGYKEAFYRDAFQDDPFTIQQFCQQIPYFFRTLPVIEKGRLLVQMLESAGYKVTFLTRPMDGMPSCRGDKLDWVIDNFGDNYNVIFSDKKEFYAKDNTSILIDDMDFNLEPWAAAGGTAIDFTKHSVSDIMGIVDEAIHGKKEIEDIKDQLKGIDVNLKPTEAQADAGNYKKGKLKFKKLNITIENTPGSIRFGWDQEGRKWVSRMNSYYGYIQDPNANDGDKIDCFIGPKYNKNSAFIVNQNTADGMFDEHKVILGCETLDEARALYLGNYQKGWDSRIGSIIMTNTKRVRDWVKSGKLNEPFSN